MELIKENAMCYKVKLSQGYDRITFNFWKKEDAVAFMEQAFLHHYYDEDKPFSAEMKIVDATDMRGEE